jgi:aryl-alcohol dehydrogenase-like predicted oxidoreductase
MSFGEPAQGGHPWTLDADHSEPILRHAFDLGIRCFDTANVYSAGSSEEILGTLLRRFARREEVVVMTKLFNRMRPGLHGAGLSRTAIMHEVDASLKRLKTDYIDLYQIHRFDPSVPVEETMQALHDVVAAGKVRYLGASSMFAWQLAKLQTAARLERHTRFAGVQVQYNLLAREEEREMIPFCVDDGIGVMAWSPLARGRLARDLDSATTRSGADNFALQNYRQDRAADAAIIREVEQIAHTRGVSRAAVSLAWLRSRPGLTSIIVGATHASQLDDAVASLAIDLTEDELDGLDRLYTPRRPEGF